jgi:hypothetical protein
MGFCPDARRIQPYWGWSKSSDFNANEGMDENLTAILVVRTLLNDGVFDRTYHFFRQFQASKITVSSASFQQPGVETLVTILNMPMLILDVLRDICMALNSANVT